MTTAELARRIFDSVGENANSTRSWQTSVPNLAFHLQTRPNAYEATIYHPVVCLNLQGRKEVTIGDQSVEFGDGQSLIVSHELPVMARVTEASPERPYLALIVSLDMGIVQSLCDEVGPAVPAHPQTRSLSVGPVDERLIETLSRYVALTADPVEARVMAPLILREIHFRLLMADHGGMLRQFLHRDSHSSRIARAIGLIRSDYRTPLAVADLADAAGMSPSSFHQHFRQVTGTTPLQYQKDLRLTEARRLLAAEALSVASAAFEVGYESATQFSREYARKFGAPPRKDVLRPAGVA
ncbi:AraC family transcriptional regulator [Hoeflea olei]|uniref:AraC family transcriptional regulator n=1 Tax=Hoeflea olei TaxID=1480615 RepID=A0A1C1Z0A9_9HYPH|nr:AraC family transcriptional regulator [Hoeflea olei]OCW59120.1 AraC family transcriptional regulator [Hoeflea olei]